MKTSKVNPVRLCLLLILSGWIATFGLGYIFMKELKLTKGYVTKVDDADYDVLIKYNWSASVNGKKVYARMAVGTRKKTIKIYLHRVLLGLTNYNDCADHKDRDTLNNQRYNLRKCTRQQNNQNVSPANGAKYLGVRKVRSKWFAYITPGRKQITKLFNTEKEAALWYNEQALKYFGEFANLNKV
jgi:hypothetical protein